MHSVLLPYSPLFAMKSKILYLMAISPFVFLTHNAFAANNRIDLLGTPAPGAAADYTINISANTKYVNVKLGDTVRFVSGNKEFTWSFDAGSTVWAVGLNQIAPAGMLDHRLIAYVSPFRRYFGRDDT
jgi:hypothetical protein